VLEYCDTPKEESKIIQRFGRIAVGELRAMLKGLQAEGNLGAATLLPAAFSGHVLRPRRRPGMFFDGDVPVWARERLDYDGCHTHATHPAGGYQLLALAHRTVLAHGTVVENVDV
jgi:hypothetical protein